MVPTLLFIAVVLVVAAGAFACADAALGTVSPARVHALYRERRPGAKALSAVVSERPRHVNLLLLLRLVCELTATVLVTMLCWELIDPIWLAALVAAAAMVVASYVLVGVGPRTIGRQHAYRVGLVTAPVVRVLGVILGRLSLLLITVGNAITPGGGFRDGPFSSEIELRELVDLAGERGLLDDAARDMVHSVFGLSDTIAREVMVPRTELVWIEQSKSVRQALTLSLRTGFTRLPVIGESVDEIVGVLNLKDLARAGEQQQGEAGLAALMQPAAFIPDTKRIDGLLKQMQRDRTHLAIVVDEYGGTAGLLTIEDMLEEIVGEITDESDHEDRAPVEQLGQGALRVSSRLPVEEFAELFGLEIDDPDVETVGGLLAQWIGRVPLPGTEAEIDGVRLRAEGGKDRRGRMRITSVLAHPAEREGQRSEPADGDEQASGTGRSSGTGQAESAGQTGDGQTGDGQTGDGQAERQEGERRNESVGRSG